LAVATLKHPAAAYANKTPNFNRTAHPYTTTYVDSRSYLNKRSWKPNTDFGPGRHSECCKGMPKTIDVSFGA
jgi:hypothetical protein